MGKKKKEKKTADVKRMMELFYMTTNEITAKDLKEAITKKDNLEVEFWQDMNILQLELENGKSAEFEPMEEEFTEDGDKAFIKNRNIKTVFYISIEEESFEEMKFVLKEILSKLGGFICTDSDKFQPIYTEDNL